jgi:hypothetical protein
METRRDFGTTIINTITKHHKTLGMYGLLWADVLFTHVQNYFELVLGNFLILSLKSSSMLASSVKAPIMAFGNIKQKGTVPHNPQVYS